MEFSPLSPNPNTIKEDSFVDISSSNSTSECICNRSSDVFQNSMFPSINILYSFATPTKIKIKSKNTNDSFEDSENLSPSMKEPDINKFKLNIVLNLSIKQDLIVSKLKERKDYSKKRLMDDSGYCTTTEIANSKYSPLKKKLCLNSIFKKNCLSYVESLNDNYECSKTEESMPINRTLNFNNYECSQTDEISKNDDDNPKKKKLEPTPILDRNEIDN